MFADAVVAGTEVAVDDAAIQVVSREFAYEVLRPLGAGQETTYTAEFVRRWFENRRRRYGATA